MLKRIIYTSYTLAVLDPILCGMNVIMNVDVIAFER